MLKTKKFHRLLAALLAVLMLSVCIPSMAFAEDDQYAKDYYVQYYTESEDNVLTDENGKAIQNSIHANLWYNVKDLVENGTLPIPEGYEYAGSDGTAARMADANGFIKLKVKQVSVPSTPLEPADPIVYNVKITYYDYENNENVGTAESEIQAGVYSYDYLISEGKLSLPEGYKLLQDGEVKIASDTLVVNVVPIEKPVTSSKVTFVFIDQDGNEVARNESTYPYKLETEYAADKILPVPPEGYVIEDGFTFVVKEANQEIGVPVKPVTTPTYTVTVNCVANDGGWQHVIDKKTVENVPEGADLWAVLDTVETEIEGYEFDGAFMYAGEPVMPGDKQVEADISVDAYYNPVVDDTPITHNIKIELSTGDDPVYITVEDGANLLKALNEETVVDMILRDLPEGAKIIGFTYGGPERDPIAQNDTVGGDFTVYCEIEIGGYTVTIQRVTTDGTPIAGDVLAWAEPGEDLLQVLNMAKIDVTADLAEGSEVVSYTYADPEESEITSVQVYGDLTVRAHISVPVTHTVTVKRDGYSDVIFTVADGTNLHDFLWKSETQTAVLEGMPDGIGSIVDYTFDRDTGNVIDDYYVVDGDVTVRAIFPVQTHTVTILRGNFDAVQITVDNGTNLYDALWSENVQDVVLAGMPGDYSIMGYTYRAGGDDVAPTDIVLADVTVRVAFESLNTPVTHTVTVKRDGLDDVVLTVEDGANLLKALWDDATQKAVKQGMPESSSITGYTWDREIGNVIDSYYKVETDVTVRAYFSTATYAVTIEREGFDDVIINVERDTKLLEALNDESVKSVILAGLPESYAIDGFTYRDGSEIIDQDIVLADVTVKAVLNQYYTVTIERSNGAPSILVAVKRGDKLLETLNSDDTMAKVMDGCDGYKVTSFTYRDGSEIIDQDIVLVNMTVRANMEAVPAEPSDPSTGDNTTTVTGKDEHPDIAEAKANGTWGAAPTAAPVAAATNTIPQTSDDMPVTMLIVIALVAAGAAGGLVVLRKRSHQ